MYCSFCGYKMTKLDRAKITIKGKTRKGHAFCVANWVKGQQTIRELDKEG